MNTHDLRGPAREWSEDTKTNKDATLDRESPTICLIGPGWTFTSGISYYTCRLSNSVADQHATSVILLRRLLPRFLYPGKVRVGLKRSSMEYSSSVSIFDGIDWWWGYSLARAVTFLRAQRPKVLLLEWWTAATFHTYLFLAVVGRVLRSRVVLEIHELQDPGEADLALARRYGQWALRTLLRLADGCIVHSESDRQLLEAGYGPLKLQVALAPHGPYDQYSSAGIVPDPANADFISMVQAAPRPSVANLLFFGLIRPYKGLEDLLHVFNALSEEEADKLWLTVVGETWEGCTQPAHLIATSPHADRITFVNEYVPDEVVAAAFTHADVVVLPYRRSSSSGILHVAMNWGLPTVVTSVGGLPEAATGYEGAIFVPPGDLDMLKCALLKAVEMAGQKFADPRDWQETVDAIHVAAQLKRELDASTSHSSDQQSLVQQTTSHLHGRQIGYHDPGNQVNRICLSSLSKPSGTFWHVPDAAVRSVVLSPRSLAAMSRAAVHTQRYATHRNLFLSTARRVLSTSCNW